MTIPGEEDRGCCSPVLRPTSDAQMPDGPLFTRSSVTKMWGLDGGAFTAVLSTSSVATGLERGASIAGSLESESESEEHGGSKYEELLALAELE
ncbi:hypothetical protein PGT21_031234 [Puccinia graminis f. sp. tritici]|uniref:Uncharacterized protein n=1 Tax=Puccinia graminis f. sp. tritici TaxID=56615 RepID=A0A5B0MFK8_PUCGR|nr:hypothetical protein PGTUg99_031759 [Puccinia graminis f. sp. tritici]KAA1091320.1 hypothetical protein PGT21_031234 [Puccinia graminis f. sp. tritici]